MDYVLRDAQCCVDGDDVRLDIEISDGSISALTAAGSKHAAEAEIIDIGGRRVVPGLIDTHCHIGQLAPEYESRPGFSPAENWQYETRSALAGGVTTVLNYVKFGQGSLLNAYDQATGVAASHSAIDVLFHGYVMNDAQIEEIDEAAAAGMRTFKIFMPYRGREAADLGGIGSLNHAQLRTALGRIAGTGSQALIHAEDGDIVEYCTHVQRTRGHELADWEGSRPIVAEGDAAYTALYLSMEQDCPVTIVHVSSLEAVGAFRRLSYSKAALESCPHYLILSTDSALGPQGKVAPPLRGPEVVAALWTAVLDGSISFFGSDHNVWPAEAKTDMWSGRAGLPGVGLMTQLLATELVWKRGLRWQRFIDLTSTNAARRFGLYPKKGSLRVGADADLVVLEEGERSIRAVDLWSAVDYSPYEGYTARYWPLMTFKSGLPVFVEGAFAPDLPHGRVLNRAGRRQKTR